MLLGAGNGAGARRWVGDFALAFILFWAVVLLLDAGQSRAYAVSLPVLVREAITLDVAPSRPASLQPDRPGSPAGHDLYNAQPGAQPGPEQARLLLSLAFATLAAVNLGFCRHLRRVYASPRRSVWRRG
jgi:hypothetical protein